jgi:parallel beta-helix repeat protein
MSDRASKCVLSLTLCMIFLALMPAVDFEGIATQSTTVVSEPEKQGMLLSGIPHGPIAIDGDTNFSATALLEGWPGDGNPGNPYIIDGLDIDLGGAVGNCISIRNTQVHFTIRNCNLTGASGEDFGAGINLEEVVHGELLNNIVEGNRIGILVGSSFYYPISDNTFSNKTESGIWLTGSNSNIVVNNTCYKNLYGIAVAQSNNVADNVCNNNDIGISLFYSVSNALENNTCTNNGEGIALVYSSLNIVINNNCSNNTEHGINLNGSGGNTVANNICNSNTIEGISLFDMCGENSISNNICNNNSIGIHVRASDNNTLADNTCLGNIEYGICLSHSNYNTVTNNICNNNDIGIYVRATDTLGDMQYNTVVNNSCNNNDIGIHVRASDNNTLADNTCLGNIEYGICLSHSNYNNVTNNICNNNDIGIYVESSEYNAVEHNICLGNIECGIYLYLSDNNRVTNNFTEFNIVVLLLVGLGGITIMGAGWWKFYTRHDSDDIIVPIRYRVVSWFRNRRALTHVDVDEPLEPDSSDQ